MFKSKKRKDLERKASLYDEFEPQLFELKQVYYAAEEVMRCFFPTSKGNVVTIEDRLLSKKKLEEACKKVRPKFKK